MNDYTRAYNQRQYRMMLAMIEEYENQHIGLKQLVSNLEGLVGVLEITPDDWRQAFLLKWGLLEEVYSVARVEKSSRLDAKDSILILKLFWNSENLSNL